MLLTTQSIALHGYKAMLYIGTELCSMEYGTMLYGVRNDALCEAKSSYGIAKGRFSWTIILPSQQKIVTLPFQSANKNEERLRHP
jgi:hypothetical protein